MNIDEYNELRFDYMQKLSQEDLDAQLDMAVKMGDFEAVQHLLASPKLKKHANLRSREDYPLREASLRGDVAIVKYILTSPELTDRPDIHTQHDVAFRSAFINERIKLIEYFIYDLDIEKNDTISEFLNFQNSDFADKVKKLFEKRELNKSLNNDLKVQPTNSKKNKV